jgi:hypothetical protein
LGRHDHDSVERGVKARNVAYNVDVARAGPGGHSQHHSTDAVTGYTCGTLVAGTVVGREEAAELQAVANARWASASRGKAACGPPCGPAAPQENDTSGTTGQPSGQVIAVTSLVTSPMACGGRPHKRQRCTTPQGRPQRLGAGPSNAGRDGEPDVGGWPAQRRTERRRDGSVDARARAEAARGGGGAATPRPWKRLSKSLDRRATGARHDECGETEVPMDHDVKVDSPRSVCNLDPTQAMEPSTAAAMPEAARDGRWPASAGQLVSAGGAASRDATDSGGGGLLGGVSSREVGVDPYAADVSHAAKRLRDRVRTPVQGEGPGQREVRLAGGSSALAAGAKGTASCGREEPSLDPACGSGQPRHRPRRGPVPRGCIEGNAKRVKIDRSDTNVGGIPTPGVSIVSPPIPCAARAPALRPRRRPARQRGDDGLGGAAQSAADDHACGSPCAGGPDGPRHLDGGLARHHDGGVEAVPRGDAGSSGDEAVRQSLRGSDVQVARSRRETPGGGEVSTPATGDSPLAKRRRIRGKQSVPSAVAAMRLPHASGAGTLSANSLSAAAARIGPSRLSDDLDSAQCGVPRHNRDGHVLQAPRGGSESAWSPWRGRPPEARG